METKVSRKDFSAFNFDFGELEQVLAELIDTCFDLSEHDFNNQLTVSFTMKLDETGYPKIQSFGKNNPAIANTRPASGPLSRIDEDDLSYTITLDLLGHEKNDVEAILDANSVVIMSRKNIPFYRKFFLNKPVHQNEIKKTLKNNVLEIVLKKMS